jgi:hypothetical protein
MRTLFLAQEQTQPLVQRRQNLSRWFHPRRSNSKSRLQVDQYPSTTLSLIQNEFPTIVEGYGTLLWRYINSL